MTNEHNPQQGPAKGLQIGSASAATIAGSGPLTMSSSEIADLTGKRHDNVMRDIRLMLIDLDEGGLLKFEDTHRNPQNGQTYPIFRLPKRECIILVSGYDVQMRARIVDRWMALEAAAAKPADPMQILNDPTAMRGLLLTYTEKVIALEAENEELAGKARQLARLEGAEGSMCLSDAAKTLGARPSDMIGRLSAEMWIFKRAGNKSWLAYQDKIQAGYLEHHDHLYFDGEGRERVSTRCLVTAKGLVKIAELLSRPLH